jgi:hypothetical protein
MDMDCLPPDERVAGGKLTLVPAHHSRLVRTTYRQKKTLKRLCHEMNNLFEGLL